jgi:putative ABC transport system ATP-binding protein
MTDKAMISLRGISKAYTMGGSTLWALNNVDLDINKGEFVAIMGASGSGKSTLMNILGCLDVPAKGSYHLDGTEVQKLSRDELAMLRNRKLGFVFQSFNLLSRTSALENVELPMLYNSSVSTRESHRRALVALETVGLEDRAHHFSNQLSGGQQQRVAIARSIVNDPVLILADEPTGNLDTHMSVEIMAVFQGLNDRGITVVVVTHEQDIAQYTKRNVVFRDGAILSDTPVAAPRIAARELSAVAAGS